MRFEDETYGISVEEFDKILEINLIKLLVITLNTIDSLNSTLFYLNKFIYLILINSFLMGLIKCLYLKIFL